MKLTFLGTRGGITARSSAHYMQSSLLIRYRTSALIIDWGTDWLKHTPPPCLALLITHGHSDHAGGLASGFPYPVYATAETAQKLKRYPLTFKKVTPRRAFILGPFTIETFPVYHSVLFPAVGYRISAGAKTLFYCPDLISIIDEADALKNLTVYIGDGALTTRRMLVRKKEGVPVGHSPIKDQLAWCKAHSVPKAIITHCGSELVKGNREEKEALIENLGELEEVETMVAFDGMKITL